MNVTEYDLVKYYHDKPEYPEIVEVLNKNRHSPKNFTDNLLWNDYPVCTRCKIRHVSEPHRKYCNHCFGYGGPPKDESYQCAAVYKTSKDGLGPGGRCNQPALKGRKYCKLHAGRGGRRGRAGTISKPGTFNVSRFYAHVLGPTLQKVMDGMEGLGHKEILDLKEEVILARAAAGPKVKAFNNLVEWFENNEHIIREALDDPNTPPEVKEEYQQKLNVAQSRFITVSTDMQEALMKVTAISEKANAVYQKHVETIEVGEIHLIVDQLIRIMYDVCGPKYEWLAQEFKTRVETEVSLPGKIGEGKAEGATANTDLLIEQMIQQSVGLPDANTRRNETDEPRYLSHSKEPGDTDG